MKKWDELFEIYTDILKTRKQPHQNVSLFNYLKSLKQDTQKLLRVRNTSNVNRNTSGFMKPVNISDELRKFIDLKESGGNSFYKFENGQKKSFTFYF